MKLAKHNMVTTDVGVGAFERNEVADQLARFRSGYLLTRLSLQF
jgi:hypothetical protein